MIGSKIRQVNTYWHDAVLILLLILGATLINSNWAFSPLPILPKFGAYYDHWFYEVLDSLKVFVNGIQLVLERIPQGADTLFQAQITGGILNDDVLELVFETDRISRPADLGYAGDPRTLGVALDWLTIEPIE